MTLSTALFFLNESYIIYLTDYNIQYNLNKFELSLKLESI